MSRADQASEELIDLVSVLRLNGYRISTEQYIAAQRLLTTLAAQGNWLEYPDRLGNLLAPIFCSSREEQATFPKFYEQWLKSRPSLLTTQEPPKIIKPNDVTFRSRFSRRYAIFYSIGLVIAII